MNEFETSKRRRFEIHSTVHTYHHGGVSSSQFYPILQPLETKKIIVENTPTERVTYTNSGSKKAERTFRQDFRQRLGPPTGHGQENHFECGELCYSEADQANWSVKLRVKCSRTQTGTQIPKKPKIPIRSSSLETPQPLSSFTGYLTCLLSFLVSKISWL